MNSAFSTIYLSALLPTIYISGVLIDIARRSAIELWPSYLKALLWPLMLIRWGINSLIHIKDWGNDLD